MSTGRRACARLAEVSTSGKVGKVIHALFGNAHVATRGNPGIQSVAVGGSRASNVMKVINQRPIWRIPRRAGRSEPCPRAALRRRRATGRPAPASRHPAAPLQ